jgi:hypothetical protein
MADSDTIQRKDITGLLGLSLKLCSPGRAPADSESLEYQAWRDNHLILVRIDTNQPVATVMFDDLFDATGNRFNDNRA